MVKTSYGRTSHVYPVVRDLPEPYATHLCDVFQVWNANLAKNLKRRAYYEGKNRLQNIGMAIPEELSELEVVVGWPAKTVNALAIRSRFDGFTSTKGAADEVNSIFEQNHFSKQCKGATRTMLIHGPSFVTVTRGGIGEPQVRIRCYSAVNAACTWNYDLMRIGTGLTVHDVDKYGRPTRYELYEDDCIIDIVKVGQDWTWNINPHPAGRPLMEPLVYDSDTDYPLGHSRITRAVMNITDRAVQEAARMDLASELSACPQKYLLGGYKEDMEAVKATKTNWEMYIGSIMWLTKDKDGEKLDFGQLSQPNMDQHIKIRDSLAAELSSETDIPVEMLGVPSTTYTSTNSAEAAMESLVAAAENMDDDLKTSLVEVGRLSLAVARNTSMDKLTSDELDITAMFRPERFLSESAQADAWTKLASATASDNPLTKSRVFWERQGLDKATVDRVMNDINRTDVKSRIEQMASVLKTNQESSNGAA